MSERDQDGRPEGSAPDGVSLHKPHQGGGEPEAPLDFDPYRFGAPEHPVPPEYAPPGYRPPPPPVQPPMPSGYPGGYAQPGGYGQPGQYPPYQGYPGYPGYPPQGYVGGQQAPVPPAYGQYPPPRTGNGKATAALVLGIASIVFCWLTVLDLVPVVLAIVFGSITLSEVRRTPGRNGRRLAIAGIVCAVVGAILAIVISLWAFGKIHDCLDLNPGSSAYHSCVEDSI